MRRTGSRLWIGLLVVTAWSCNEIADPVGVSAGLTDNGAGRRQRWNLRSGGRPRGALAAHRHGRHHAGWGSGHRRFRPLARPVVPRERRLPERAVHQRQGRRRVHRAVRGELPGGVGVQAARAVLRRCAVRLPSEPHHALPAVHRPHHVRRRGVPGPRAMSPAGQRGELLRHAVRRQPPVPHRLLLRGRLLRSVERCLHLRCGGHRAGAGDGLSADQRAGNLLGGALLPGHRRARPLHRHRPAARGVQRRGRRLRR